MPRRSLVWRSWGLARVMGYPLTLRLLNGGRRALPVCLWKLPSGGHELCLDSVRLRTPPPAMKADQWVSLRAPADTTGGAADASAALRLLCRTVARMAIRGSARWKTTPQGTLACATSSGIDRAAPSRLHVRTGALRGRLFSGSRLTFALTFVKRAARSFRNNERPSYRLPLPPGPCGHVEFAPSAGTSFPIAGRPALGLLAVRGRIARTGAPSR